jgi:hypothetical protein
MKRGRSTLSRVPAAAQPLPDESAAVVMQPGADYFPLSTYCHVGVLGPSCGIPCAEVTSGTITRTYSKLPEEDNEAGELDKAEEVLRVVLPADDAVIEFSGISVRKDAL